MGDMQRCTAQKRSAWEIACRGSLDVRHETIHVGRAGTGTSRLLYASDLHLSGVWTERPAEQLLEQARQTRPDLILLGGDLVCWRSGLGRLSALVAELSSIAPVYAVPGNHDKLVGRSRVKAAVVSGGGVWLEDKSVVPAGFPGIRIDGQIQSFEDESQIRVLCAHDPAVWQKARAAGYAVVLAGHLHGLQWVAFERRNRMYPGAWFWRWNGDRFEQAGSTMIVSRGVSDTVPIRLNCPREVILCELTA